MKKRRKIKPHNIKAAKNIKLGWKVRRQVQQELLQKKLAQCFLMPREGQACLERYPEAMQPMIKDFIRRADEQMRLHGM
jgi:uncharacterized protein YjeT (DUF2065 family)